MTTFILGVDPGTVKVGIALVEVLPARIELDHVLLFKKRPQELLGPFLNRVNRAIVDLGSTVPDPVSVVACESTHVRRQKNAAGRDQIFVNPHAVLNQAVGAVRMAASTLGAEFVQITPAEWRQGVTGSGNAGYGFVHACLEAQLGKLRSDLSDDELAAISIALVAARKWQTAQRVKEAAENEKTRT